MVERDPLDLRYFVNEAWKQDILPTLIEYISIPNKSPGYDPNWREAGHMERVVTLIESWCRTHGEGMEIDVTRLEGRTPLIYIDVPARGAPTPSGTVLLYGHLDKQPECGEWRTGLSPWTAVREGDRLYGRGSADDGYAVFAAMTALRFLAMSNQPHARCVILIETGEESGSPDLPAYLDHLKERLGTPDLVICLDSGAFDYKRLWLTTSLRGVVMGDLRVDVLTQGVHSGEAGGIVPSSFFIAHQLLSRITSEGKVTLAGLEAEIPPERIRQAMRTVDILGNQVYEFPWAPGTDPRSEPSSRPRASLTDCLLDRTWRPAIEITGADGLPPLASGNVLRPFTTLRLSMRLPPTTDSTAIMQALKQELERDPPGNARVTFTPVASASGWNAPPLASWLEQSLNDASSAHFGRSFEAMGEGGAIPFMTMLGKRFPQTQFVITGVLGPESNAHGPNEFLHLPTAEKLTCCVAHLIADHAKR